MSKWTKEEQVAAEHKAITAYEAVAGKVILITDLDGYVDDRQVEIHLEQPALARVVKLGSESAVRDNVLHWTDDDWIDPYLDLEILTKHPELATLSSCWIFGHSFNPDGRSQLGSFALAPLDLVARHSVENGPWTTPPMKLYEVTLAGFDGGSDDTDDLVKWIAAPAAEVVEHLLAGSEARFCGEVQAPIDQADYVLPRDNRKLADLVTAVQVEPITPGMV